MSIKVVLYEKNRCESFNETDLSLRIDILTSRIVDLRYVFFSPFFCEF